jgi:hypothetical protein
MSYAHATAEIAALLPFPAVSSAPGADPLPSWDGPVASTPLYEIALDPTDGLVLARTRGFWTLADADAYIAILRDLTAASRVRFGRVRLLVDLSDSAVHTPEVARRFLTLNALFSGPRDKCALVTCSSLKKMQIRRTLRSDQMQVFVSQTAARLWIAAYP